MSDIVVSFKAKGEEGLLKAIKLLDNAQKGLGNTNKKTHATHSKLNQSMMNLIGKYGGVKQAAKAAGVSTKFFRRALKGSKNEIGLINAQLKKATVSMGLFGTLTKRNAAGSSSLALSFSTMRSKLLLLNFALGMGIAQMAKFAQAAAKVEAMERGFNTLAGGSANAAVAIDKLTDATNGTLSNFDLFQQANNAMILGVTRNSDEMADLFGMAKKLGDALGRDVASSVESLVTGIGRQSRMMLDNLGIIVDTEQAYKDYAAANKLTASSLTDAEKKQAFMNATLDAAREKIKDLPKDVSGANESFQQFAAATDNLNQAIGDAFLPIITKVADAMTAIFNAFDSDRVQAYASVVGVGLTGAFLFYISTLKRAVLWQTRLGWGALATAAGFLAAEIVVMAGFFEDSEEPAEDLAKATDDLKDSMDNLSTTAANKQLEDFYDTLIKQHDKLKMELGLLSGDLFLEFETMFQGGGSLEDFSLQLETLTGNTGLFANTISGNSREFISDFKNMFDIFDMFDGETEGIIETNEELNAVLMASLKHFQKTGEFLDQDTMRKILANERLKKSKEDLKGVEGDDGDEQATIQDRLTEAYNKLEVAKIEQLAADIALAEIAFENGELNVKQIQALKALQGEYAELTDEEKRNAETVEAGRKARMKSVSSLAMIADSFAGLGQAVGASEKQVMVVQAIAAVANAYKAASDTWADETIKPTWLRAAAAGSHFVAAYANVRGIYNQLGKIDGAGGGGGVSSADGPIGTFAEGGYVGGRPHSQGGTIIEAERGEFVMSRNATESIGLETLNQMNQSGGGGSINVSVTGNVLTQDFVEGELAESIKEAVRKGSDFGLN